MRACSEHGKSCVRVAVGRCRDGGEESSSKKKKKRKNPADIFFRFIKNHNRSLFFLVQRLDNAIRHNRTQPRRASFVGASQSSVTRKKEKVFSFFVLFFVSSQSSFSSARPPLTLPHF